MPFAIKVTVVTRAEPKTLHEVASGEPGPEVFTVMLLPVTRIDRVEEVEDAEHYPSANANVIMNTGEAFIVTETHDEILSLLNA